MAAKATGDGTPRARRASRAHRFLINLTTDPDQAYADACAALDELPSPGDALAAAPPRRHRRPRRRVGHTR